ncbi:MAG: 3-dehydroquinate synthase [SAR324 cluster bacterium]|nr:3-dehydroquinate synthase [SAR324 cluster bacterium]
MKRLQLQLTRKNYHYQITVGRGVFESSLKEFLSHHPVKELFIVTNDVVAGFYPDFIQKLLGSEYNCHTLVLPDGEKHKNIENITKIYDFLSEKRAHRGSLVVAFGGGVIGDMVGFASATYMRGLNFLQVPTTLLSQVDSSIGGKTGYNHKAGKNFIGAFKQPAEVIIDVDFLKTLPLKEFKAGYAELIKHAFIADAYLFQLIHKTTLEDLKENTDLLTEAIIRSLEVKARIVEQDETETGKRAMLNFGHTLGHYFETFTKYEAFLHGEAVISGMEFAAWWSMKKGYLATSDFDRISEHLQQIGIRLKLGPINKEDFVKILGLDKKAGHNGVKFIAISSLGASQMVENVQPETLWEDYKEFLSSGTRIISQPLH